MRMIRETIVWVFVCYWVLAGSASVFAASAGNGDANFDGFLTTADLNLIRDYELGLFDLSPQQLATFDLNADSKINVADAVTITNHLTNKISIDVSIPTGAWTLTGPSGFKTITGTGDRLGSLAISGAPSGSYRLHCDSISGYATPLDLTANYSGGILVFTPNYLPAANDAPLTITLPGGVPMLMVNCPPGTFKMGRYPNETGCSETDDYQHDVTLTKSFYVGKFEVTKRQYTAVTGKTPWIEGGQWHSDAGSSQDSPANYITWNDIAGVGGFIDKLNQHLISSGKGGLVVRLPTEAEWEYAGRAGTTTRFYWGENRSITGDYAWFYDNSVYPQSYPRKVGLKKPNAWGLYDVSGNIAEWCQDWMGGKYPATPATDPTGSLTGTGRILRGGSYGSISLNTAGRLSLDPGSSRSGDIGFRLALSFNGSQSIQSVTIGAFNHAVVAPGAKISNAGTITGKGSGAIEYHWITKRPDGITTDSGPFKVALANGVYNIPTCKNFPTDLIGEYQTIVRVTKPVLMDSAIARYTVATPEVNIQMITVPAGTFTMGGTEQGDDAKYGNEHELPRHQVTLRSYRIGKYEVTMDQFRIVLDWAYRKGYLKEHDGTPFDGYIRPGTSNGIWVNGYFVAWGSGFVDFDEGGFYCQNRPDLPMVEMTWYGSVVFCNWLSEKEGLTPCYDLSTWKLVAPNSGGYRLPSEAEWERAAAWDGTKHWVYGNTSDTLTHQCANYGHTNPIGIAPSYAVTPVGWYNGLNNTLDSPSPVGCYDMSGNVSEWCGDFYHPDYNGAPADGSTWETELGYPYNGSRVLRGGGWYGYSDGCRTASRGYTGGSVNYETMGFRVARSIPVKQGN